MYLWLGNLRADQNWSVAKTENHFLWHCQYSNTFEVHGLYFLVLKSFLLTSSRPLQFAGLKCYSSRN
uniref:Uncharacterized protein n=1 Tax=Rhizophora mucronata TaxID=61149 RepID=A0A2P2JJ73_RHIMU